jgi:hypothetical protein
VMSQKEIARGSAVDLVDAIKIHNLSQR